MDIEEGCLGMVEVAAHPVTQPAGVMLDAPGMAAWLGEHIGQVVGGFVVVATLALVTWRLMARRNSADVHSGMATAALALVAVAVPASSALWWNGATAWAFWWTVGVAALTAGVASTEWLRTSLRWFALLALVALGGLLLRLGSQQMVDVRCGQMHALAAQVGALQPQKGKALELATATSSKARAALKQSVQTGGSAPGLLAPAQGVVAALSSEDSAALTAAIAQVDAVYRPNTATRADTILVANVDKAAAAARAVAALRNVDEPTMVASLESQTCGATRRLVTDVELTQARSATAEYRNSIKPSEVTKTEAKKSAAAADAATERAARGEDDEGTDLVSLLEHGAIVAGSAALAWLPGSPEAGNWFWVVLAVLLLGGWWLVERRSASTVAGPVKITFNGADVGDADKGTEPDKQAQEATFVTALTKNLRQPGPTPGSQATSPLTDLEGVVTAAGPGKVLTAILTVVKSVFSAPCGSTVTAQLMRPLPGAETWRLFVVVADAATSRTFASKELADESAGDVCRVAGYWAAATVLSASPRVPQWARWSPATAHAFAAYDTANEPTIDALRTALHEAPASSLVLHKLADRLSLDEKYADAVGLYARAVVVDPTDLTSLYRLAATLATLSRNEAPWAALTYSRRAATCAALNRAAERLGLSETLDPDRAPPQHKADVKDLASALFKHLHDRLRLRSVALRSFSRDQREAIGSVSAVLNKYGRSARSRASVKAAGLSVGAFDPATEALNETKTYANDPRSGWQVGYNLACHYASTEQAEDAIWWLEVALNRPGVEALGGAWLAKDPDLDSLRSHPRYLLLCDRFTTQAKES